MLAQRHEALLFDRAYPRSQAHATQADAQLLQLAAQLAALSPEDRDNLHLEEPEISGLAHSGLTAVFSYGVALHLARLHPLNVRIAWEACDSLDALGRLLPSLLPRSAEEAFVEAHVPFDQYLTAAARRRAPLPWLLNAIKRAFPNPLHAAERYDSLQLPLRWDLAASSSSRTLMRCPTRSLFFHTSPLITRAQVSLDEIPQLPPLPARPLSRLCGNTILALARDTSAVRYRELHGFTWGDPASLTEIDAGRGVKLFLSSLLRPHRLPLRAYHAISIWKNGVPAGYFEGLSLCERMEAGFNLYFTFRNGETAWLYARILQACHQLLGVTNFIIHPYQLGHDNPEGLHSGALWFYRKLGFRSTCPQTQSALLNEERRLARTPGARSPIATLRRLAAAPMLYAFPGHDSGDWDRFSIRRLSLAPPLPLPAPLLRARHHSTETRYLALMQRNPAFRAALLSRGARSSPNPRPETPAPPSA